MSEIWKEQVRGEYPDPRLFGLSGLAILQRGLRGLNPIPPITHLTGMKFEEVNEHVAIFSMPATDWFLSSQDHISVGAITMLADAALGSAVQIGLPPATPYTTAELSMTFLALVRREATCVLSVRPCKTDDPWRFRKSGLRTVKAAESRTEPRAATCSRR